LVCVEEAISLIHQHRLQPKPQKMGLEFLDGAYLLEESIASDRSYPPTDRSLMDGIALSLATYETQPAELEILGICAAGDPKVDLPRGAVCYEIMTGAPIPFGADLVIPLEDLAFQSGDKLRVKITHRSLRRSWDNIHREGSDCESGAVFLKPQMIMTGPRVGIAASFGAASPLLRVKPRVKIINTGDELIPLSETPQPHQLRSSNGLALRTSLKLFQYPHVKLEFCKDDKDALRTAIIDGLEKEDDLLLTGGVSKGKFDFLPEIFEDLGIKKIFHQVSQRPGKPFWFGTHERSQTNVFGFPGNPISCLICLHRYYIPQKQWKVRLRCDFNFNKPLTYFLPVKIEFSSDGVLWADPIKTQNSAEFVGLAESDGFIELPPKPSHFKQGEVFTFFAWSPL
jgi:molybdopterin molybdotransferase